MPILKSNPTLADIQQYVKELEQERGFSNETVIAKCLLLGEELGELYKAIRKADKVTKVDEKSAINKIEDELPDILIVLCTIANRYGINLEEAFREKEEINKKRVWQ